METNRSVWSFGFNDNLLIWFQPVAGDWFELYNGMESVVKWCILLKKMQPISPFWASNCWNMTHSCKILILIDQKLKFFRRKTLTFLVEFDFTVVSNGKESKELNRKLAIKLLSKSTYIKMATSWSSSFPGSILLLDFYLQINSIII